MVKSIFIIVASVFLTFFCSIMVSAGDETDAFRTAVRNIFDTYSAANIAGDTVSYISLWDEDGIKMGPNKPAVQGRPTIEKLKRKGAQKWNYESQDIKIYMLEIERKRWEGEQRFDTLEWVGSFEGMDEVWISPRTGEYVNRFLIKKFLYFMRRCREFDKHPFTS